MTTTKGRRDDESTGNLWLGGPVVNFEKWNPKHAEREESGEGGKSRERACFPVVFSSLLGQVEASVVAHSMCTFLAVTIIISKRFYPKPQF